MGRAPGDWRADRLRGGDVRRRSAPCEAARRASAEAQVHVRSQAQSGPSPSSEARARGRARAGAARSGEFGDARRESCPRESERASPGVGGKTTIVRAMLATFDRASLTVRLAAPTGRAAKRLSEATGHEASTLHRLLEFEPRTANFKRNGTIPVEAGRRRRRRRSIDARSGNGRTPSPWRSPPGHAWSLLATSTSLRASAPALC